MLRLHLLFILIGLFLIQPVSAQQSADWLIYLHSSQTHTLHRINSDGTETSYLFEFGYTLQAHDLVISPDGRLVALCLNGNATSWLLVRDIAAQTELMNRPFEGVIACHAGQFNTDSTQISVGIVYQSPYEGYTAPDLPLWSLQVIDIASAETVLELNSDLPYAPDFEALTDYTFETGIAALPLVRYFDDEQIIFSGIPFVGREPPFSLPTFSWSYADNTVIAMHDIGRYGADYLPQTGEIVYPTLDENYPYMIPYEPNPETNTVYVHDAQGTRPIYRNTEWQIYDTTFVNDGQQVAISMINLDNALADRDDSYRYLLLNRDGTIAMEQYLRDWHDIRPVPNGALVLRESYFDSDSNQRVTHAQLDLVQNGNVQILWSFQSSSDNGGIFFDYAWTPPIIVDQTLRPFLGIDTFQG